MKGFMESGKLAGISQFTDAVFSFKKEEKRVVWGQNTGQQKMFYTKLWRVEDSSIEKYRKDAGKNHGFGGFKRKDKKR